MKKEKERLEYLQSLSYEDYLQTPEWQAVSQAALKRAGNCCQLCLGKGEELQVHHRTAERLGCEQEEDLLVLCGPCTDLVSTRLQGQRRGMQETGETPALNLSQRTGVGVVSALVTMGLPALLHAPLPAEVFGFGIAIALAVKSPKIYAEIRSSLPGPLVQMIEGIAERKEARAQSQEWNEWDRLLGRHLREAPLSQVRERQPVEEKEEPTLIRVTEHVAERVTEEMTASPRRAVNWASNEEDFELGPPTPQVQGPFVFSSVLKGFVPSLEQIYLASTQDGQPIFCHAEDLCHVALAGSTDGGKTSIIRMLAAQLCKAGAQVLLLNPHYTRYDVKKQEDWTPFEAYLSYDPMECRKYEVIEHYLRSAAQDVLPKRLERYARSEPTGKPYFLVLDELPSIVKRLPNVPGYLSDLLREGRKVGMFLISASQDFLVKTISPDGGGGAVRDCYRTAYYVGGDATTAKVLLDMVPREIPEDRLGKGWVMLRCARAADVKKAQLTRVPYVDNAALYSLLGPSTYQPTTRITEISSMATREPALVPPTATVSQQGTQIPARPLPEPTAKGGERRSGAMDIETLLLLKDHVDEDTFRGLIDLLPVVKQEERASAGRGPAREERNPVARKGLSPTVQAVYEAYEPGVSYHHLAKRLAITPQQAWEALQQLQRRGYIQGAEGSKRGEGSRASRGREVREEETYQKADNVVPFVPTAKKEPTVLERGIEAYRAGAVTQPKLAAALSLTAWEARQLMAKIEVEMARQAASEPS